MIFVLTSLISLSNFIKEDDAMAVRSDRQQSELRALNAGTIS